MKFSIYYDSLKCVCLFIESRSPNKTKISQWKLKMVKLISCDNISWNPKVRDGVHKSPRLDPILDQMNPFTSSHPVSLRLILILSFHQRQVSQIFSYYDIITLFKIEVWLNVSWYELLQDVIF
jgi:hypothetical protein